ncbi:MAG: hypothetical protein EOP49_31325 [Sphingobacteriales bacterium]|nr:MAG: hypothetical protein EOP49_31325 [Sphingobacteriales bacterium]
MAARRAGLLDKITIPVRTIREQDSLLALALLSEGEQKAVIQKYLRYLEQKQTDSIERAANAADALAAGNTAPEGPPTDWYFANPMLVQQGLADFKRKWGTRPNSDNWRRVKTANVQTGMVKTTEKDEVVEHTGLPTEASLLAAIPSTVEKQQGALVKIRKAYIDLANGYVGDLKDYPSGLHTLDTMEHRFGAHEYKAEATYLRYRIAMEQNRLSDAQSLSTQLSTEFKNTKWGQKVAPAGESEVLYASNVPVSSFYDETYSYMMQRDYPTVLKRVREGQRQYKDPVYTDRFTIMEAIALAGAGDYGRSDTLLTEFLSTHPKDSLKDWAEKVIEYVKKNKPAEVVKPVITDSMARAATVTKSGSQSQVQSPNDVAGKENKTAPVIPAVYTNDFNNFNYASQKLSVNLTMLQPTLGLISVKNFQNANQARIYLNAVRSSPQLLKEYKQGEYQLLMITEENYRKLEADKSMEPYLQFYQMNYK